MMLTRVVIGWVLLVSTHAFQRPLSPTAVSVLNGNQRAVIPRWASPQPSMEGRIRTLLDEAVELYSMPNRSSSDDEIQLLVGDIGTALYQLLENGAGDKSALPEILRLLDETVVEASRSENPVTFTSKIEALAIQYRELEEQADESRLFDTVSNLESRLNQLKGQRSSPSTITSGKIMSNPNMASDTVLANFGPESFENIDDLLRTTPLEQNVSGEDVSDNEVKEQAVIDHDSEVDEVDIAIVGSGIGGLCAGAILNTLYGKKVGIYESHYLPGGCAHAFDRTSSCGTTFTFDSGPTIVLGCSAPPYNPLRQVLNAIGKEVEWIPYGGWGMIENPCQSNEIRWTVQLGTNLFEEGPLTKFGGENARSEFHELKQRTKKLVSGAVAIPAMAMRSGQAALIPLLRYLPALFDLIQQGEELTSGTFAPYMDGPIFEVKDRWLRSWLDALAFSLSGLPASRTSAAAMAYVLYDMHREGSTLDYPKGGLGTVIDALVEGVEQGSNGSKVNLRRHVESIDTSPDGSRFTGLTLRGGKRVKAREGIICNAPVWSLNNLIKNTRARRVLNNYLPQMPPREPRQTWSSTETGKYIPTPRVSIEGGEDSLLFKTDTAEMTGSFLHLHLAIKSDGLVLDDMEAHYTVMDRSLAGDGSIADGPCGELNMIAVSNPCVIDRTLAPPGHIVIHAYGAGNEPYDIWKGIKRNSPEYLMLKEERAQVLWRAVESIIPDVRQRVVLQLVGSPQTHERFLRRPNGTYGSATEDYLKDGSTPYETLVLAGDGIFPGIGVPSVALSGASAANSMVSPLRHWRCLDKLNQEGVI